MPVSFPRGYQFILQSSDYESPLCSTSSPTLVMASCFCFNSSGGCVGFIHFGFICIFQITNAIESFIICLLTSLDFLFFEVPMQISCPFFYWDFFFFFIFRHLLLDSVCEPFVRYTYCTYYHSVCDSLLYSLHSVFCLSFYLLVSFDKWRLLILM